MTTFDAALVRALATVGTSVHIPKGWAIMMEMTPADSAYILLKGSVEVRKSGEVRRTLGPGDVFGEIALVDHRLRSASIVASTDVTALRLEGTALQALVDMNPAFADALRSSADSRLAAF
ncbi:cyclic nucleotide-binding domain-containing protein [Aeromicrobium ginsengisoli]|uniref:Cyclic nucleotide-binding domain-containing protein n=2 Tax=Aeromicrobium ginsengisoli TaxID=363867 RepID=A0A5M4FE31_9ACTN|nr:cyclic nucleotide-binding domain-containing protein [Aeromicrobium ginsengisoli]